MIREKINSAINENKHIIIYGAGKIAQQVIKMLAAEPYNIVPFCCAVTSIKENEKICEGLPVLEISKLLSYVEKSLVLVTTVDKYKYEIRDTLRRLKFINIDFLTFESQNMEELRLDYIENNIKNPLDIKGKSIDVSGYSNTIEIFMMCNHNDKNVMMSKIPRYITPLQVGKYNTDVSLANLKDDVGDNISYKNMNYCELTGLYWIWKNLNRVNAMYVGICHYRRWFNITYSELKKLDHQNVDAILTIPIVNIPSVKKTYEQDHSKKDWFVMMDILKEMSPEYYEAAVKIFDERIYSGYNMVITRKKILADYCAWLFPILKKIEEKCQQKESRYQNRFMGILLPR